MFMNTAVILAGGLGTRLRPVTYELPKPLITIQGKTLLEHQIDLVKRFGVRKVYLSLSYMPEKIIQFCSDKNYFGLDIEYLIEEAPLGTAGPLVMLKEMEMIPKDDFVMMNGDILTDIDLREKEISHVRNNAVATISLFEVPDPSAFGVANLEKEKIVEFIEKPKKEDAPTNLINTGYYLLSPKIFDYLPDQSIVMMEKDVFPKIAREGKLFSHIHTGQWFDIGTFESWEQAIKEWKGID